MNRVFSKGQSLIEFTLFMTLVLPLLSGLFVVSKKYSLGHANRMGVHKDLMIELTNRSRPEHYATIDVEFVDRDGGSIGAGEPASTFVFEKDPSLLPSTAMNTMASDDELEQVLEMEVHRYEQDRVR